MSKTADAIAGALFTAVKQTVRQPTNDAPADQADMIAGQVLLQPAVQDAVARIENATNAEPWYQSRVILGSALALIGATYTLGLDFADGTPPTVEAFTAQFGVIVGSIIALYGRLVAKKSLGQ